MLIHEIKDFLLIHLTLITYDDSTATIMCAFQHKLIRELVKINVLYPIPNAITLSKNILQAKTLNILSNFILIR